MSRDHSISSKISESGMNAMVVPVSLDMPIGFMSPWGTPRAYSCR